MKHAIVNRNVARLILPDELQTQAVVEAKVGSLTGRIASTVVSPDEDSVSQAVAAIAEAQRPLVIVGYDAWHSMPAIIELAERLDCPVVTTFKAKVRCRTVIHWQRGSSGAVVLPLQAGS